MAATSLVGRCMRVVSHFVLGRGGGRVSRRKNCAYRCWWWYLHIQYLHVHNWAEWFVQDLPPHAIWCRVALCCQTTGQLPRLQPCQPPPPYNHRRFQHKAAVPFWHHCQMLLLSSSSWPVHQLSLPLPLTVGCCVLWPPRSIPTAAPSWKHFQFPHSSTYFDLLRVSTDFGLYWFLCQKIYNNNF